MSSPAPVPRFRRDAGTEKRPGARREQWLEAPAAQGYFILKAQEQSEKCPFTSQFTREDGGATRLIFQEILGGAESSGACLLGQEPLFCCLVTESGLVDISEPEFSHLESGDKNNTCLLGLL